MKSEEGVDVVAMTDKEMKERLVKEVKREEKKKKFVKRMFGILHMLVIYIAINAVIMSYTEPDIINGTKTILNSSMSFDDFAKAADKTAHEQGLATNISAEYSLYSQIKDMSKDERDIFLYGSKWTHPDQTEPLVETITVPIWLLGDNGERIASTASFRILGVVAQEVVTIFTEIYNTPEKPPIHMSNEAGYDPRPWSAPNYFMHPRGLAIDISVPENWMRGRTIGYWAPPSVDKSLWSKASGVTIPSGGSEYSIAPDSPIVIIFKKYGWGWGGDWSKDKDYMHFSIGYPGIMQ